jgi:Protein of unknown function (DUF2793)
MEDASPRFALPFIVPGQAQKEHFHNEALLRIDAVLGASALAAAANPPAAPANGACWIVAAGAAGAWAGRENSLAVSTGSGWRFVAPAAGMRVWNEAAGAEWRWTGTAWSDGALFGSALFVGGQQVVSERQSAIASPSGGTIIDAEARAAVDQIIVALKTHGLID